MDNAPAYLLKVALVSGNEMNIGEQIFLCNIYNSYKMGKPGFA